MSRQPLTLHTSGVYTAGAQGNSMNVDLGDPAPVLVHARQLANSGQTLIALHVIDLVAGVDGDAPALREARELKAQLCSERAPQGQLLRLTPASYEFRR